MCRELTITQFPFAKYDYSIIASCMFAAFCTFLNKQIPINCYQNLLIVSPYPSSPHSILLPLNSLLLFNS